MVELTVSIVLSTLFSLPFSIFFHNMHTLELASIRSNILYGRLIRILDKQTRNLKNCYNIKAIFKHIYKKLRRSLFRHSIIVKRQYSFICAF